MVWTYPRRPAEAPVRSGVIRQTDNERRHRGRPNLTWEESVKRDLKDWCITKELALDRREWKIAIHVLDPSSSVPSLLFPFCQSLFPSHLLPICQSFFPFYSPLSTFLA
jgi:hypothetical protein